MGIILVYDCTD